jgi:ABC-type transporter Mla MlaB component
VTNADSAVIAFPDEITMATCNQVAISLQQKIAGVAGAGPVALDAATLKKFDSSFWSVYATLKRNLKRTILLNNLPVQLQALGQVYGVWGGSDRH